MAVIHEGTRATLWSAKQHRMTIGILGTTMPFVVALVAGALWFTELQSSVSQYYYSGMGAYFVGVLFSLSLLLLSYRGHPEDENKTLFTDNVAGNLAGAFGLATALIPTTPVYHASHAAKIAGIIHYGSAFLFFVMLIYFCLVLFPKTDPEKKIKITVRKLFRNKVFKICGYIMIVAIVLLVIYFFLSDGCLAWLKLYQPIYWLEAIMVMSFGFSWLVKGGAFFKDPPEPTPSS